MLKEHCEGGDCDLSESFFPVSAGENGGVAYVPIASSSGRYADRSSLSALKSQCNQSGSNVQVINTNSI
jgi:hypothetical protein